MIHDQTILSVLQKFQSDFNKKYIAEKQNSKFLKNFEFLTNESLNSLIRKVQYIEAVCAGGAAATLIGFNDWGKKNKKSREALTENYSKEQNQLSNSALKEIKVQVLSAASSETQEMVSYFFARHLQLFFNNKDNWHKWYQQLKDPAKVRTLKFLEKKWFAQNQLAIVPAKILLYLRNELDDINEYIEKLKLKLESHAKVGAQFKQQLESLISNLDQYAKKLQSQLRETARLRLAGGQRQQTPDRDHVVNEILDGLMGLGITMGQISDKNSANQVFNDLQVIRIKEKKLPGKPVKKNVPYQLDSFRTPELYYLNNTQYLALQKMSVTENNPPKKSKRSKKKSHIREKSVIPSYLFNPAMTGYGILEVKSKDGKTMYQPENISIPTEKPINPLSGAHVHFEMNQKNQLLLATNYALERQDLSIKSLSVANFNRSAEKSLLEKLKRIRQNIVLEIEELQQKLNQNNNHKKQLKLWLSYYEARLTWVNNLLNQWLTNILSPQIEHLLATEQDVRQALKYYKAVASHANDLAEKNVFSMENDRLLQGKIDELQKKLQEYDGRRKIIEYKKNSLIVERAEGRTTSYIPRSLSVPAKRPRLYKLFVTENFHFALARKQQVLLIKLFDMGIKLAIRKPFTPVDFAVEKEVALKIKELSKQIKDNPGLLAWRKRAILSQWQAFYQGQLNGLKQKFSTCVNCKDYLQQKELAEIQQGTAQLLQNLQTSSPSSSLSPPMAENLKRDPSLSGQNIPQQTVCLPQEPIKPSENTSQILVPNPIGVKKNINLTDLTRVEEHLAQGGKDKNSRLYQREAIKYWLRRARHGVLQLHAHLNQALESQNEPLIQAHFETLHRVVDILGQIFPMVMEQDCHYGQEFAAVLQKIAHLYLNIVGKFEYRSAVAIKAKALLEQAMTQLEYPAIIEHVPAMKQALTEIYAYGERIANLKAIDQNILEQITKESMVQHIPQLESLYQAEIKIAKEKQDLFLLKKNVAKLIAEKNIETVIKNYLDPCLNSNCKKVEPVDVLAPFHRLKNNKNVDLTYLQENNSVDNEEWRLINACESITLYKLIELNRYADRCRLYFKNEKNPSAEQLREIAHTIKALVHEILPQTKQPNSAFCSFFYKKFSLAMPIQVEEGQKLQLNQKFIIE